MTIANQYKQLSIYLDPEDYKILRIELYNDNISFNAKVREWVDEYLKQKGYVIQE